MASSDLIGWRIFGYFTFFFNCSQFFSWKAKKLQWFIFSILGTIFLTVSVISQCFSALYFKREYTNIVLISFELKRYISFGICFCFEISWLFLFLLRFQERKHAKLIMADKLKKIEDISNSDLISSINFNGPWHWL